MNNEEHPELTGYGPDQEAIEKLKLQQDFVYAISGGLLVAFLSAIIWAVFTVATNIQIGFMAIGVGFLVGYAVRFFGLGIDLKFGYLGAGLALLGCLAGNLFSQVGFIAREESLGYFETLTYLTPGLILNIMIESFNPMDILFYGLAIFEGYKFSFRNISSADLNNPATVESAEHTSMFKLRLPLVIVSSALIIFFIFMINKGVSGLKTYYFESGEKMSEGQLKNSKEQGKWTYWHENGNVQTIAYYKNGLPDGTWQWFDENGLPVKSGNYKWGLEHGTWIEYYENGNLADSGSFFESRMHGEWKFWFEDGTLYQTGFYDWGRDDGTWKTYHENGRLESTGNMAKGEPIGLWDYYFDDGKPGSNIEYLPEGKIFIKNAWDTTGKQMVADGNGMLEYYSGTGQLVEKGKIENGARAGKWIKNYVNGMKNEEGTYENGIYLMQNSWNENGIQQVKEGNGWIISHYPGDAAILETGKIVNGLKEGQWLTYYASTSTTADGDKPEVIRLGDGETIEAPLQNIRFEINYQNGDPDGIYKSYFESGQLQVSGNFAKGKKEGEWTWYNESGNISSTAAFINDKKEGRQVVWCEAGEKIKEESYVNGEFVEEKILVNE
jgi:antitoxin component YwqK of YwqJK toxin-antitoxin module